MNIGLNRQPKAEPNENRLLSNFKALDVHHFGSEFHRKRFNGQLTLYSFSAFECVLAKTISLYLLWSFNADSGLLAFHNWLNSLILMGLILPQVSHEPMHLICG